MATTTKTIITMTSSLKQIRRAIPDIKALLTRIGYAPVTSMINAMPKSDTLTFSNIARAAGLTEIEIELLVEELNERLGQHTDSGSKKTPRTRRATKSRTKTKAKTKTTKRKGKSRRTAA